MKQVQLVHDELSLDSCTRQNKKTGPLKKLRGRVRLEQRATKTRISNALYTHLFESPVKVIFIFRLYEWNHNKARLTAGSCKCVTALDLAGREVLKRTRHFSFLLCEQYMRHVRKIFVSTAPLVRPSNRERRRPEWRELRCQGNFSRSAARHLPLPTRRFGRPVHRRVP